MVSQKAHATGLIHQRPATSHSVQKDLELLEITYYHNELLNYLIITQNRPLVGKSVQTKFYTTKQIQTSSPIKNEPRNSKTGHIDSNLTTKINETELKQKPHIIQTNKDPFFI